MPYNASRDPCRIVDSDSEDEGGTPIRPHIIIKKRAIAAKNISKQPATPILVDWSPRDDDSRVDRESYNKTDSVENYSVLPKGRTSSDSSLSDSSPEQSKQLIHSTSISAPENPSASSATIQSSTFDPIALLQEDLTKFIYTPIPQDYPSYVQCRLRRDTDGVQGGFFPTFYMQIERSTDNKRFFVLAARKVPKVNRQTEYVITTNVETLSKGLHGDGCAGKLRGNNVTGTEYTLYDNGLSPNKTSSKHTNKDNLRRELAAIVYNVNILGIKGPRQISAMIPELGCDLRPSKHQDGILGQWRDRRLNHLIQIRNKSPKYNEETKAYVLQFIGNRVAKASVKNFQMAIENENGEEQVVMQFGRVDKRTFTCDFRYPLSAIQAFSIALSSFDSRLARE